MNYQSVKSNKILFIGDSWVDSFKFGHHLDKNVPSSAFDFWNKNGFSPLFFGSSSRDVQTILDLWIKSIPYLSTDDLLVIILPFFGRTRLPNNEYGDFNETKNIPHFKNYFIGTNSYNQKSNVLEIWGNQYEHDYFIKKLETQELINSSNASILNFTEIIDSLYKITPCKKIVHCWDYKKIDSNIIIYREEMTELLGMWETNGMVYERTNGEFGSQGDFHWSHDMDMKFMNFLLKYFNDDKNK
jgi:hypothetical protein